MNNQIFFAIPSAERKAAPIFINNGLNFRHYGAGEQFPVVVTNGAPDTIASAVAKATWVQAAVSVCSPNGQYIPTNRPSPSCRSFWTALPMPGLDIVFATQNPLDPTFVADHNLERVDIFRKGNAYTGDTKMGLVRFQRLVNAMNTPQWKQSNTLDESVPVRGKQVSMSQGKLLVLAGRILRAMARSQFKDVGNQNSFEYEEFDVTIDTEAADTYEVDMGEKDLKVGTGFVRHYRATEGHHLYVKATPTEAFITLADKVEQPCHLFPFIAGTVGQSVDMLCDFLETFAMNMLGQTEEAALKMLIEMRRAFSSISSHEFTQTLAHIAGVLRLGHQSNASVRFYMDGVQYLGAQLLTSQTIVFAGVFKAPIPGNAVRDAMGCWITTDGAEEVVRRFVGGLDLNTGMGVPEDIDIDDFDDGKKIHAAVSARVAPQSVPVEVIAAMDALNRSYAFFTADDQNIETCLTNIADSIVPDTFMWHPTYLTNPTDRILIANLGMFGPKSISFLNPGGVRIDIYQDASDDPQHGRKITRLVKSKNKGRGGIEKAVEVVEDRFAEILVSRVTMTEALADFKSFMNTKAIAQLKSADTKMYANVDRHVSPGRILLALRLFGIAHSDARRKKPTVTLQVQGEVVRGGDDDLEFF